MQTEPKVNILIVDDQPENLLALEAILGDMGENLVKAASGEEALRCLLHQDFAVILLDVQMPGIDGFETASLVRSRSRSRQTPIIFLTAFGTNDQMVFKGYSLGAVDYLLKPLNPTILTSKVTVFVELFKKAEAVKRQAAQLVAMNAELRQSEERFRSLSACSPVGIFVIDPFGTCIYTNPRAQALCGLTPDRNLEAGWFQSLYVDDRERALASWSHYTHNCHEYSEELRFQLADTIRWTHVRSSRMLSTQGELTGYVGTIEDITERKQSEAAKEQVIREQVARQEAEAANRMKDEFLAVLSHELRTPLNSMLGWSRLLRTKKFDDTTIARALETIERNAQSQAQLIEDILDVSQIIRGKLKMSCHPINLASTIEAALNSVRPQADAKNIQISAAIDVLSVPVWGDPTRLQQVIWNLLTNAIKFTPAGGRVTVQLEQVEPQAAEPESAKVQNLKLRSEIAHAKITVTDTGIGIDSDFLPKVFDRFLQADSTTSRSHSGLGLGLAIVRHLVELHGGLVEAHSLGEGKGSTFIVKLPLRNKTEAQNSIPKAQPTVLSTTPLSTLRVLVVDDEPDNRELVTFILKQHDVIVTSAATAQEALEILARDRLDLLISDIGMPHMDGYALIQQVRSWAPEQGGDIPAIALTAYAGEANQQKMLAAGFQQHLPKPVEPEGLITAIVSLIKQTANAGYAAKRN